MKAPLLLSLIVLAAVNCTAHAETLPATFTIGSARIAVSPPFGFTESSKATPFLSRYFAGLVTSKQFSLGGFLTDKEFQTASTGAEPALWHVAFAYSMEQFRNESLTAANFAEIRTNYRDNIKEAVQSSADKTRNTIEKLGGSTTETVSSEGVFLDDASSFAYLAKSSGARVRINATGLVLVRGKLIILCLNKVCLSDVDVKWTKDAMKWWIDKTRSDNP